MGLTEDMIDMINTHHGGSLVEWSELITAGMLAAAVTWYKSTISMLRTDGTTVVKLQLLWLM